MALTERQQTVIDAVRRGMSVCYTGCAGTGKSYLLRAIVDVLPKKTTWVTAMTGVAAMNIGGRTLHSRTGMGLANQPAETIVRKMRQRVRDAWVHACTTIIIDEISMMSRELFEKIDDVARRVRKNDGPFGGVQLVLCGDFYQLPPVSDTDTPEFCFESPLWQTSIHLHTELTQVFRQTDEAFVTLLQEVRKGKLSSTSIKTLQSLDRPLVSGDVKPTQLYPTNAQVDTINLTNLEVLGGKTYVYDANDYAVDDEYASLLERTCIAPSRLVLKQGAQVMLIKNIDEQHVNGSRGVVVGFQPESQMPIVRFRAGKQMVMTPEVWEYDSTDETILATRTQVPLRLAWAMTVHKSQGMTIDYLEVDMKNTFAYGQAYVALSRARTLDGLCVRNFHPSHVRTHPLVDAVYGS